MVEVVDNDTILRSNEMFEYERLCRIVLQHSKVDDI